MVKIGVWWWYDTGAPPPSLAVAKGSAHTHVIISPCRLRHSLVVGRGWCLPTHPSSRHGTCNLGMLHQLYCRGLHLQSFCKKTSDYGWIINRNSNNIHPASPGCRPGTYPLIKEAEEETPKQATSLSRHDHRITCTCNCCCSKLWATRTQQSHYHGYQD